MVVVEKQKKLNYLLFFRLQEPKNTFLIGLCPAVIYPFWLLVKGSKKGLQFVYWWRVYLIMPFDLGLGRWVNINIIESVGTYPGYYNIVL